MNELYVTADVKTHKDNKNKVARLLSQLAKNSMEEPGCKHYQILKSTEQEGRFTTFEIWESEEAEQAHWQTAHLKLSLSQLSPLFIREAVINKYKDLS